MSKVVTHAVVANERDEMPAAVRRVVCTTPPFVDRVDLCDRSTSWGDDEGLTTKHVDGWIIVMVSPVTHVAHGERKEVSRCRDRGRRWCC